MKVIVSAIQFNPSENLEKNLELIDGYIRIAAKSGSKLIVLPEICEFGYNIAAIEKHATQFPNVATKKISGLAKEYGAIIVAGLAEKRLDKLFNTAVVFGPDGGIRAKYDKTHLCKVPPFNEPSLFSHGQSFFVTDVIGIKIGIAICFDSRFPEVFRKLALMGAQIIVHPAAFPRMRIDQLELCVRTRALENQLFMITANFCGLAGSLEYGGRSMIIDPIGDIRAKAKDLEPEIITSDIDLDDVERFRKEQPIFSQRRPEIYKL